MQRKLASLAVRPALARMAIGRRTYPYSIIPGGVRNIAELREIMARDYVVRRHYAHFNLERAELVSAHQARLVYMSYRRGDAVYWTRKRVQLSADELLLTDGVITARARCGNQISETPKPEVAEEEPPQSVFDLPVAEVEPHVGLPFRSTLLRPSLPAPDPLPPPAPALFAGGFGLGFSPFGAGTSARGVCETPEQEQWENSHGIVEVEKHEKLCKHKRHAPHVPEPATLVLISSGLAGIYWRCRRARGHQSEIPPLNT